MCNVKVFGFSFTPIPRPHHHHSLISICIYIYIGIGVGEYAFVDRPMACIHPCSHIAFYYHIIPFRLYTIRFALTSSLIYIYIYRRIYVWWCIYELYMRFFYAHRAYRLSRPQQMPSTKPPFAAAPSRQLMRDECPCIDAVSVST